MDEIGKVLVVDDEAVVRQSYRRSLAGQNCSVETAEAGPQALESMQSGPADVVLIDLRMPGMDGLATLKAIKEQWPETEVVVITGYPSVYTAREAVRLGAFDYLTKPVSPDQVLAVTREALARKGSAPLQAAAARQARDTQKGWANYLS